MKFLQYILFLIVAGLLLPCAVIAEDSYVPDTVYMLHYFAKDYVSSYLYSADGERVWKFAGTATMTYSNGLLVNSDLEMDKTFYPTPQTTFDKQKFYKHYFIGSERISTSNGQFVATAANTPPHVGFVNPNTTAGSFIDGFNDQIKHALDSVGYHDGNITIDPVFSCIVQQPGSATKGIGPILPPIVICATQYYYHYNHQGSVALLTDKCGNKAQHLQYLPYGGTFVDHRTGSYSSTYTFSAKEKDSESGYTYFGARYYSDNIMQWLSVDPMSDKYPSMSPYMYCAGNPIGLKDPNGEDIWIVGGNAENRLNAKDILMRLLNSPEGAQYVEPYLNSSDADVYIAIGKTDYNTLGCLYREVDDNGNVYTPDISKIESMGFGQIEIDKEKTNYFITLDEKEFGGRNISNSKINKGAKVLGHEIGAHAHNPSKGETVEHGIWGQSAYDLDAEIGSPADLLNKSIDKTYHLEKRLKTEQVGNKYRVVQIGVPNSNVENGMGLNVVFLLICFIFTHICSSSQEKINILFRESPTKYVVKSKTVTKRSKDSYDRYFATNPPRKFPIYYEGNEIILEGIPVHLFKWGEKPIKVKKKNKEEYLVFEKFRGRNWDFISFNGDTIFKYSYNHKNCNSEKSIFCIFSKSYEDSTDNYSYYRKYKDCHYYQNIKDSVYVFEQEHILCVKKKISDNRWEIIDKSYANRGVFEFGVSRIYGFIYVKVDYGKAIVEYWYQ